MQPAILSSKDPRYIHKGTSPLIYGVRKHGAPTLDFDKELVMKSVEFWKTHFDSLPWKFPFPVKVYTLEEAALGRPEVSGYFDWLPDNTSAGWPYNTKNKLIDGKMVTATKKKHWMYYERNPKTQQPEKVTFDPQVLQDIERDFNYRKQGLLAPIVFQDVLKDEKRKVEKLMKEGGTRVFSMSPINASLALRQYSLDFTSFLRSNRFSNWMGVGINPDGPEWATLVNKLKAKGNNMFSIDFSNFGPGLNADVASEFFTVMDDFYTKHLGKDEERSLVSQVMIRELINSLHLAYRTVILLNGLGL